MKTDSKTNKGAMPEKERSGIERACRERGLRMTGPRHVIASLLDAAEDHPDVIELHRRAAGIDEKISLSTVYRTLRLFAQQGIIDRLDLREGRSRYEPATGGNHFHLVDLENGNVIEFRSEEIEKLQAEIAQKLGYRLVSHRLELYAIPLPATNEKDT